MFVLMDKGINAILGAHTILIPVVLYSLFVVAPIVCRFCGVNLGALLIFAIMGLVDLHLLCCVYLCSVSFPRDAVGGSVLCGVFWLYSLAFCVLEYDNHNCLLLVTPRKTPRYD